MSLDQIVYISKAVQPFNESQLDELLQQCRKNNAANDITGVLLYSPGFFMQLIEGEHDKLTTLYKTILGDGRHTAMRCLIERRITGRFFPSWSMGLINLNQNELAEVYVKKIESLTGRQDDDGNLAFDILLEFLVRSR